MNRSFKLSFDFETCRSGLANARERFRGLVETLADRFVGLMMVASDGKPGLWRGYETRVGNGSDNCQLPHKRTTTKRKAVLGFKD